MRRQILYTEVREVRTRGTSRTVRRYVCAKYSMGYAPQQGRRHIIPSSYATGQHLETDLETITPTHGKDCVVVTPYRLAPAFLCTALYVRTVRVLPYASTRWCSVLRVPDDHVTDAGPNATLVGSSPPLPLSLFFASRGTGDGGEGEAAGRHIDCIFPWC